MKKEDKTDKLSPLGKQIERTLAAKLKEVTTPTKPGTIDTPTYSLTDIMKVLDRALKWEAIQAKVQEDEGSFFNRNGGADSEDE